jgi:hypothetical protein
MSPATKKEKEFSCFGGAPTASAAISSTNATRTTEKQRFLT